MRKLIAFLLVFGLVAFTANLAEAQEEGSDTISTEEIVDSTATEEAAPVEEAPAEEAPAPATTEGSTDDAKTGFQVLKEKFIEGDWRFMSLVLICLILGLAFCIERIITLNIATTNTD